MIAWKCGIKEVGLHASAMLFRVGVIPANAHSPRVVFHQQAIVFLRVLRKDRLAQPNAKVYLGDVDFENLGRRQAVILFRRHHSIYHENVLEIVVLEEKRTGFVA